MFKFSWRPNHLGYLNTKFLKLSLSSKAFNTPRPPKDPPDEGYQPQSVDHQEIEVSDFVGPAAFRKFETNDVTLGPSAGKSKTYKNPHYFGYHRFSFVELQNQSTALRDEGRKSGGVQVNIDEDEEDECPDDSLEAIKEREAECDKSLEAQAKESDKNMLKKWCNAIEKKQEEFRKAQHSNKDNKERSKGSTNVQKLEDEKKTIQKTIEKKAHELLKGVSDGKPIKSEVKRELAECEQLSAVNLDRFKKSFEKDDKKVKDKEDKCATSSDEGKIEECKKDDKKKDG